MKNGHNSEDNKHHEVTHAKATTAVHKYKATVYDEPKEGPTLAKGHLEERFNGDIEGDGVVETLQATNKADGSSTFVGIQRITGKIGKKEGAFLFQVSGKTEKKIVTSNWFVIPGSGTGQLSGLRGEGGFEAHLGEGGEAHLDYWFE